ncbi:MAG: aldo/keto reductase [Planctomycetaceae bacterium]|nr:aldo/keto reductase [Planctomycetaceae bacterium]
MTLAGGAAALAPLLAQDLAETVSGDMRYRPLGRTGERVSLIGLGGFHLGDIDKEEDAIRLVRRAVDAGVTFMDNCWDYHNGVSELRMGKALEGVRDKVFLMTKIDGRTRPAAARQIDESLRRLKTDRLDLLQIHEVIRLEDPDRIFAEGGAIEAVEAAKKAGKTRFIGFTGHKDPVVHLRMLETAAAHGVRFDTVQMPLNVMDAHFRSFGAQVLPVLLKEGVAPLAMKSLGSGMLLGSGVASAVECLHYTMSLPVSTVITGIDSPDILQQALDAVKSFKRLTAEEVAALLKKSADAAQHGKYELFKTAARFDGTARHPEWME